MSKDVHTSHYVLIYEMSVSIENHGMLSSAKQGLAVSGTLSCSSPTWHGSVA